jgi:hypothetical protein
MEESEEKYFCIVCGQQLLAGTGEATCSYCGKKEEADYICPEDHYVCETCRLASAEDVITTTCETIKQIDPMAIALLLMKHPAIPIHGSENHLVAAYSLLTALKNTGKTAVGTREYERVAQRVGKASGGICGSWGVCGCAIAAGTVTSVVTGATYLSDKERSLALRIASRTLDGIAAIGGPRCCKASVFVTIRLAAEFLDRELAIPVHISADPKPCVFSKWNDECLARRCPYYGS